MRSAAAVCLLVIAVSSEAQFETEVDSARNREVTEVDTDAAGAADRRVVPVRDRIEPGIVGQQEDVRGRDEYAGISPEAWGESVAHCDVAEAQPVDVLLDERLLAHLRVIRRLNLRHDEDRVLRGGA